MQGVFGYVFRGMKTDIDKVRAYDKEHYDWFDSKSMPASLFVSSDGGFLVWSVDGSCNANNAQNYFVDMVKAVHALEGAVWLKMLGAEQGMGLYSEVGSAEVSDIDITEEISYIECSETIDLISRLEDEGDYETTFVIDGNEFTLDTIYSDADGFYYDYNLAAISYEPARKLIDEARFWFS